MAPSAAPPSPQEIQRKLSVHSVANRVKSSNASGQPVSGTESDSDSVDALTPSSYASGLHVATSTSNPPLSSIPERKSGSGEDTDDEEDEEVGGWRTANIKAVSGDESVIKSGYLWKKGERRKTWKKRWFVLRPGHLAYYKNSAEYQLLRLLELSDVHSCTPVSLKRHQNAFGLVSPVRTFYLQAETPALVHDWVLAIEEARQTLLTTSTQIGSSNPIPIPGTSTSHPAPFITPSPPSHLSISHNMTSSESDDASPTIIPISGTSHPAPFTLAGSPGTQSNAIIDPAKTILSGYLMKCGHKRRVWRKRWFVLTGEKLVYSGSHMDTKPHRQFPFSDILDALEYDIPSHRQAPGIISPSVASPPAVSQSSEIDESKKSHTFKIVTTKRALLLCAPSEEDEIKWLGAVRALIARRSGTGGVPGNSTNMPSDSNPGTSALVSSGSGGAKKIRQPNVMGSVGVTSLAAEDTASENRSK